MGVDVEDVPLAAHHGRGADALAADVADAELDDPVGPADRVVPVAADLDRVAAREVVAGELDAVGGRQPVGQQAALQAHGELVLVREEPSALERVRGLVGERPEQVPLARLEPSVAR